MRLIGAASAFPKSDEACSIICKSHFNIQSKSGSRAYCNSFLALFGSRQDVVIMGWNKMVGQKYVVSPQNFEYLLLM
jgi:hypothetical protein